MYQSSKRCDKVFKKVCGLAPNDQKYVEYKGYRNLNNKLKRKTKQKYYTEKIEQFKIDNQQPDILAASLEDILGDDACQLLSIASFDHNH